MKIRNQIKPHSAGDHLTILMKGKPSYHGELRDVGDRSFSLQEVDERRIVTIDYGDVKKVRSGYGGYNTVSGRHVDPLHRRIAIIALTGGLIAIVVAVAATKD